MYANISSLILRLLSSFSCSRIMYKWKAGDKPGDEPGDKSGDKSGDEPRDEPGDKPGDKL